MRLPPRDRVNTAFQNLVLDFRYDRNAAMFTEAFYCNLRMACARISGARKTGSRMKKPGRTMLFWTLLCLQRYEYIKDQCANRLKIY